LIGKLRRANTTNDKEINLAAYASPLDCETASLREFVKDFRASKSFEKQCIWRYCSLTLNGLPEFALSGFLHRV